MRVREKKKEINYLHNFQDNKRTDVNSYFLFLFTFSILPWLSLTHFTPRYVRYFPCRFSPILNLSRSFLFYCLMSLENGVFLSLFFSYFCLLAWIKLAPSKQKKKKNSTSICQTFVSNWSIVILQSELNKKFSQANTQYNRTEHLYT